LEPIQRKPNYLGQNISGTLALFRGGIIVGMLLRIGPI
jgi:hypothetical protein